MAYPNYNHNQYPPHGQQPPPPVQTQNLNPHQQQRTFSPQNYQQSPTALSPTMGTGIAPTKRQHLSPNPPSPAPYQSPFPPNSYPASPYSTSPQTPGGYHSQPVSPAPMQQQQPPSFHHPQPYQHPNGHQPAPQGSMPPPKVPYSKTADATELEKANARDLDVNNISDVLTGSGIDLRAEEDNLLHSYRSFNSQASASTASAHASFNNGSQQPNHGAFQGTGPLSQEMTKEQHEAEFIRKHAQAARILNESAQQPLTDPFLAASVLRHRVAKRAYDNGVAINVDGLFDKIPEKGPENITRITQAGANGEQIVGLEAASLLNQSAPLVEILALISLAAEERIRTVFEDAFALSQGRQNTSHGIIPPQMLDIAVVEENAQQKMVPPVSILKTPWEAPDSAFSTTASKGLPNAARLPTPPSEVPPTPQSTYQNVNHVAVALTKRVEDDVKWEEERLRKRAKRQEGASATTAETPVAPIPLPEPVTKKAIALAKKQSQSDVVVFGKANETASLALGGKKKKYSWMTGGGGPAPASGASTPRPNAAPGGSGAATPIPQAPEKALLGRKRKYGDMIEQQDIGAQVQLRDLIHVLENDGKEKKTLTIILARLKNIDKDAKSDTTKTVPTAATGR
ncbi:hypothetical protein BDW02DRAFT_577144 [Decorospora gaudefroyi]|uniref:Transcription initiation factor TFIID subunit 4 n=1 Tax=Decorospora gaudefroyi TaxID=184978 RepID=A0A6A5KJN8_9PLEO|nr:hypothetical protein BDW02DRAFT_577144 [Decorospora gaudefroyi]